MNIEYIAFTEKGLETADRIAGRIGGSVSVCSSQISEENMANREVVLSKWVTANFEQGRGLVFVGAAGIAVRAIAPFIKSKIADPAVVVVDETGRYCIPILSGHLGGANELAKLIATVLGGKSEAVITTATDVENVFAVDVWAKDNWAAVVNPDRIKNVSSAVLSGKRISIHSEFLISGSCPWKNVDVGKIKLTEKEDDSPNDALLNNNCDVYFGIRGLPDKADCSRLYHKTLYLAPRILTIGIGTRKGVECDVIEHFFQKFIRTNHIFEQSIIMAATIDIKSNEPGLIEFVRKHDWGLKFFSCSQLKDVQGSFHESGFVNETVGVGNVCERSAVAASGGRIVVDKTSGNGITMALAQMPYNATWF